MQSTLQTSHEVPPRARERAEEARDEAHSLKSEVLERAGRVNQRLDEMPLSTSTKPTVNFLMPVMDEVTQLITVTAQVCSFCCHQLPTADSLREYHALTVTYREVSVCYRGLNELLDEVERKLDSIEQEAYQDWINGTILVVIPDFQTGDNSRVPSFSVS